MNRFGNIHQELFWYTNSTHGHTFNEQRVPLDVSRKKI